MRRHRTINYGRFSEKVFGFVFPAVRFKPGTAGYKARTLPLCYAVPPRAAINKCFKKISQPKNKNTFSDFNGLRFLRVVMLKEVLSNNTMKGAQLNLIITIFNIHLLSLHH